MEHYESTQSLENPSTAVQIVCLQLLRVIMADKVTNFTWVEVKQLFQNPYEVYLSLDKFKPELVIQN